MPKMFHVEHSALLLVVFAPKMFHVEHSVAYIGCEALCLAPGG
jgi:hypothetical protein